MAMFKLRVVHFVVLFIASWLCASAASENQIPIIDHGSYEQTPLNDDWETVTNGLYGSYVSGSVIHVNFVPDDGYNYFYNPVDYFTTATKFLIALRSVLANDTAIGKIFKRLDVTGTGHGNGSLVDWTDLTSTLTYLPLLEEMHWNHQDPIPAAVLDVLDSSIPFCKLYYTLDFGLDSFRDIEDAGDILTGPSTNHGFPPKARDLVRREPIVPSNALYHLDIRTAQKFSAYRLQTGLLRKILKNAPNLRELRLNIPQYVTSTYYNSLNLPLDLVHYDEMNEPQPSVNILRSLELHRHWSSMSSQHPVYQSTFHFTSYDSHLLHNKFMWHRLFDCHVTRTEGPEGHEHEWNVTSLQAQKSEGLDTWLMSLNFALVQEFSITAPSGHALYKLALMLSGISRLKLLDVIHHTSLNLMHFLAHIGPLQSLHLSFDYKNIEADCSNFGDLVEGLRNYHGSSLKELHMMDQREEFLSRLPPPRISNFTVLGPAHLSVLGPSMTALETLELSLPRPEEDIDHFTAYFKGIGSMPNLRQVIIHVNSFENPNIIYLDSIMRQFRTEQQLKSARDDVPFNETQYLELYQIEKEKYEAEYAAKCINISMERLSDEYVNKRTVKAWVEQIRQAQASSSTATSITGGSLQELEVILGQWSWKTWELAPVHIGRLYQAPVVSGRFICKYTNGGPLSQTEGVSCNGGYRWSTREHYPPSFWPDIDQNKQFPNSYCTKWRDNAIRAAVELHSWSEADASVVWEGVWDPDDPLRTD